MATKVEVKTDKAPSMDQTKFPFSQAASYPLVLPSQKSHITSKSIDCEIPSQEQETPDQNIPSQSQNQKESQYPNTQTLNHP